MSVTPTRLQVGTSFEEAIPLLNDNFENVIQDIRDLGANLSTTGRLVVTVPASSLVSSVMGLTSKGLTSSAPNQIYTDKPANTVTGILPYVDIYVDTDADATKLFPFGSGLTSGQMALFPVITVGSANYTNSLGAWIIQLNNRDTVPHTYYVYTKCGYFPTGAAGQFR